MKTAQEMVTAVCILLVCGLFVLGPVMAEVTALVDEVPRPADGGPRLDMLLVEGVQNSGGSTARVGVRDAVVRRGVPTGLPDHAFDDLGERLDSVDGFGKIVLEGFANGLADTLGKALGLLLEVGVGYGLDDRYRREFDFCDTVVVYRNETETVGFQIFAHLSVCGRDRAADVQGTTGP